MNQRAKAKPAAVRQHKSSTVFADAAPAIGGILSVLIAYTFQSELFADLYFYPAHPLAVRLAVRRHDVVRLQRDAACRGARRKTRRAVRHARAHPVGDRHRGRPDRLGHAAWREQPDARPRRHVRHADDRAQRHDRHGADHGRDPLLGAGLQPGRRARLSRGDCLACGVRADPAEPRQDRARPESRRLTRR